MNWRAKRKLIVTLIIVLPLATIAGIIYWSTFFPDPTCTDGVQNGTELGVDCGGACENICQSAADPVDVVWARSFQISDDNYNLAAYIENPNTDLVARDVPYRFQVYDENDILITEKRGQTALLPQPINVVFVDGIETNGRTPARTTFSFGADPFWREAGQAGIRFQTTNQELTVGARPRLELTVTNGNAMPFSDIRLAALVFNQSGRVVQVSRTTLPGLDPDESGSATFTWREPFSEDEADYRVEVLPVSYQPLP